MNTMQFSYNRQVDYSLLFAGGFTISQFAVDDLWRAFGDKLSHGETRLIKIEVGGQLYDAQLTNLGFDRNKYPNHPDIIQIRYALNGALAKALRAIFHSTATFCEQQKAILPKRSRVKIPDEITERIVFCTTDQANVFGLECFTLDNNKLVVSSLKDVSEETFENVNIEDNVLTDSNASIEQKQGIVRYRKYDRSICETLKRLYDYRCQVTGERVGDPYGQHVVEAHHLAYFTQSLNNDSTNIVIISPNFHRIIHRANPTFNLKKLQFEFPNGVTEKLTLNKHLGCSK